LVHHALQVVKPGGIVQVKVESKDIRDTLNTIKCFPKRRANSRVLGLICSRSRGPVIIDGFLQIGVINCLIPTDIVNGVIRRFIQYSYWVRPPMRRICCSFVNSRRLARRVFVSSFGDDKFPIHVLQHITKYVIEI
jgi:hypothetical protein